MTGDMVGDWAGTLRTETTPGYAVQSGGHDDPLVVARSIGAGPRVYAATLSIVTQSDYEKYYGGSLVSIISGSLTFYDRLTPATGFIDDAGVIRLAFYENSDDAWTLLGRLIRNPPDRTISGKYTETVKVPPWVEYSFGTLSVTKLQLGLAERVNLHTYEHFPF